MKRKTRVVFLASIIAISGSSIGAFYYLNSQNNPQDAARKREEKREQKAVSVTSKAEVFNLVLPCRPEPNGAIAIAHADIVVEVPIKFRLQIEESNSKLRDIISTTFRSTSLADLNADSDMKNIKAQITAAVKSGLNIDIEDILFLRFEYNVLDPK